MKARLEQTLSELGCRSSVHGVGYTADRGLPAPHRLLWLLLLTSSLALAAYMVSTSLQDWRANMVTTTLASLSRPVEGGMQHLLKHIVSMFTADVEFPTVTICGSGQYLGPVERELFRNFDDWNKDNNDVIDQSQEEETEAFGEFLRRVYQLEDGVNLLDILTTLLSPDLEAAAASSLLRHQQACSAGPAATGGARRKRSTTGSPGFKICLKNLIKQLSRYTYCRRLQ